MIEPDDADWTWVLDASCPDCGFDAPVVSCTEVAGAVRANAAAWATLHDAGRIIAGRTRPDRWSTLEYAAHVRDVHRRYDERLVLMLEEHDPLFPNWDQDASAIEERYDAQDPADVVTDLVRNAERIAQRLSGIVGQWWERPGRRFDGASFTVDSISRYYVHDPIHHLWDVAGVRWLPG